MIHVGDCIEVMAGMPEASVDAVCTDPPYGLEFMGKAWDWRYDPDLAAPPLRPTFLEDGVVSQVWRDEIDPMNDASRSFLLESGERHYLGGECWCQEEWTEQDGFAGLLHHSKPPVFHLQRCVGPHSDAAPKHQCPNP